MIGKVCVDSNIMIYAMDPVQTNLTLRCEALLSRLALTGQIALSPQAINETISVLLRKQLKLAEIKNLVLPLIAYVSYPIDQGVVQRALQIVERYQTSWWDALMIGWAAQAGCSALLTEDAQSAPEIEGVRIISPTSADAAQFLNAK